MKKFGFFAIDGGQLLSVVVPSNDSDFEDGLEYAGQKCKELPFNVPDDTLYKTARLVGADLLFLPQSPGPLYIWSDTEGSWVPDMSSAREISLARAKKARSLIEFGAFTYNGMVFDGDVNAQRRLSVLASAAKSTIAAGHTFTKEFILADDSVVQLTAEDFVGIEMAKLWQVEAAFQEYRIKKAAIEAATTIEELEAITI